MGWAPTESIQRRAIEIGSGEGSTHDEVGEANEGVHDRQLAGMVEFQAWEALAVGKPAGLGQLAQLPTVDKGLQDVLLDILIVVDDLGHSLPESREIFDVLIDAIVVNVVSGRLGAQ